MALDLTKLQLIAKQERDLQEERSNPGRRQPDWQGGRGLDSRG
jgi:hypothetical protein